MTIVAVYVDDLILIAKTHKEMQDVKRCLADRFKVKDMGEFHYYLGISVKQDEEHKYPLLHQKQYILNMLERYGLKPIVSQPQQISASN